MKHNLLADAMVTSTTLNTLQLSAETLRTSLIPTVLPRRTQDTYLSLHAGTLHACIQSIKTQTYKTGIINTKT